MSVGLYALAYIRRILFCRLELSSMAGHLSVTESRSEGSQPCRQTVRAMVYQLSTRYTDYTKESYTTSITMKTRRNQTA